MKKVLLVLSVVYTSLLGYSATLNSATLNEPAHLVAGRSHWSFAAFPLYRVNPPFVRTWASLPLVVAAHNENWSSYYVDVGARPVFEMGAIFLRVNRRGSIWLMTLARWVCIPFCLLGGWICFLWARDLFGLSGGLVACALWCFSPMVLGHGSTIAPDAHASVLGLAACYTFWRWLKRPTWTQAVVTGFVLGLAELSKTTMILFYPLWPLIWIVYRLSACRRRTLSGTESPTLPAGECCQTGAIEKLQNGTSSKQEEPGQEQDPLPAACASDLPRFAVEVTGASPMTRQQWIREAGMLGLRMFVGIYVLNLGYLGEGSFTKLSEFQFVSELFGGQDVDHRVGGNRFADSWIAEVPVPFPSNYIIGIDVQQRDFEDFGRPSYLRGVWREKGWWYYYAYAILVKAPLGTLGLIAVCIAVCFTRFGPPIHWRDSMVLLAPPLVIFVVASMKSGFSHHSRYILPCVPFVFIWLGQFGRWMDYAVSRGLAARSRKKDCKLKNENWKLENGKLRRAWSFCNLQFTIRNFQLRVVTRTNDADGGAGWRKKQLRQLFYTRGGVSLGVLSALLLTWSIGSSLAVYPHSLSYFNELAGGPKNGPNHLLNSNIDWGQDLLFLEKWIEKNAEGSPVYTAFYNLYNPFDLEIEWIEPWPFRRDDEVWPSSATWDKSHHHRPVADGYYAISVNLLYDYPWDVYEPDGGRYSIDRRPHGYLRSIEPVGWAGYSIRIYSAEQMRAAFNAPPTAPLWES